MFVQPRFVADPSACFFYHTIELPTVGLCRGQWDLRGRFDEYIGLVPLSGRRVLDIYSYTGGFGIQAAMAGAAAVTLCDRSDQALGLAEQAARLNGVAERMSFVRAEAFAELEKRVAAGERFGVVICDPPAFVKSQKDLQTGARGYRKMVRLAAPLVEPGGLLFAASCSHHVGADLFAEQVRRGLADAGRDGRILFAGGAGPDHPIHPFLPESAYLKFQFLQLD